MKRHHGPYRPDPMPWIVIVLAAMFFLFLAVIARGDTVDQADRWDRATLRSADILRLDKAVALYEKTRSRYEVVQRMRSPGAPAPVIFTLHGRESSWSFSCHLHEGSPLTHRTRDEPKGRPVNHPPPFTWEESAEDALYILKHEDRVDWQNTNAAIDAIERFNGLGYRARGLISPYVWSGTNLYGRGKFVRDHVYDPMAIDKQLGCAAILKRMRERGIQIPFVQ